MPRSVAASVSTPSSPTPNWWIMRAVDASITSGLMKCMAGMMTSAVGKCRGRLGIAEGMMSSFGRYLRRALTT